MIISKILSKWSLDPYYQSSSVLDSILLAYRQFFSLDNECIIKHANCRICCPKRLNKNQSSDYIIKISAEASDWSRTIYQLAHEISHVVMECYPDRESLKWISECLCEAASFYTLDKLSKMWQKEPHNLPCAISLEEYLENKINKIEKVPLLADFYSKNAQWLADDPYADEGTERPRNDVFALSFYDIIQQNTLGWTAITHMSDEQLPDNANTVDYLNHWEKKCIKTSEKEFVLTLKKSLGL